MKDIYELLASGTDEASKYRLLQHQIENILNSYDDEFDSFAELIQNAFDAIQNRFDGGDHSFQPRVDITVDLKANALTVVDNGCGVDSAHFPEVFKPNYSLKRVLGHKGARGEKGAALAFLQFGHRRFTFRSRVGDNWNAYILTEGRSWFRDFSKAIDAGIDDTFVPPVAQLVLSADHTPELENEKSGSLARVEFDPESNLPQLIALQADDKNTTFRRFELIFRTRTAVGFFFANDSQLDIPECFRSLEINLRLLFADGGEVARKINLGFMFPHLLAQEFGKTCSFMTNPRPSSTLLYDYITPEFVQKHLGTFLGRSEFNAIYQRYQIRGYVSYAFKNQFYEELAQLLCYPSEENANINDSFLQVNGGFSVCVKEFPNGRLRSFIHRGGSEDKSRTFILLDFQGDYKPDIGRKNLRNDCHLFVRELCKHLMAFSTTPDRKRALERNKDSAPFSIVDLNQARAILDSQASELLKLGIYLESKGQWKRNRRPESEQEVAFEFLWLIANGNLLGYEVYGLPARKLLDGLFRFEAPATTEFIYDPDANPLGLSFNQTTKASYDRQWLEFKMSSDGLVDDFKAPSGTPSKKWFVTVDLLVCDRVDDATDDYEIEEITKDNFVRRRYFGVTHLMTCSSDRSHEIQVVELSTLRSLFFSGS